MRELNDNELDLISGGDRMDTYYRIGEAFADGYNWAVARTTDLFEWALS